MIKNITLLSLLGIFLSNPPVVAVPEYAYREVPFTQEDRDRIIRLEEGQKFLQQQISDLKSFMLWGFGVLFAGMFALVGFVIWDRRTDVIPP